MLRRYAFAGSAVMSSLRTVLRDGEVASERGGNPCAELTGPPPGTWPKSIYRLMEEKEQ